MSLSRRTFVSTLAAGAASGAFISARGREGMRGLWSHIEAPAYAAGNPIILSSNENPLGAGPVVIDAVRKALGAGGPGGRYPQFVQRGLQETIAKKFGVKPENVHVGCGSTQILRDMTQLFTSKTKALVGSIPTYEECAGYAQLIGSPVTGVTLNSALAMDLDATVAAARGAGLIFYCNPNNPTATVHTPSDTDAFIKRVHDTSPDTMILVDEAYIDYVTAPGHKSEVERAITDPQVIVARTFSKAYGMAGLRVGYAIGHTETIAKLAAWSRGEFMLNIAGLEAASAALGQDASFLENERARNAEARSYTRDFFRKSGYQDTESQTNFLFVDVKRPLADVQKACRQQGVLVGRPFPPLTNYARISIGTMEEMKRAVKVFGDVLKARAVA